MCMHAKLKKKNQQQQSISYFTHLDFKFLEKPLLKTTIHDGRFKHN